MARLHSRIALSTAAALILASCGRDPAQRLTESYPVAAQRILSSDGFARTGGAYLPKPPTLANSAAPLARRGGLDLQLPTDGAHEAILKVRGATEVRVRERGAGGAPTPVGAAIAYSRTGGAAYWTATASGFEEWIEVEDATDAAVAEWEVDGAALRQDGDAAVLVDGSGEEILRVTAPLAYRQGGAPARAWLRVTGNVLALYTDARGPALVDPSWTTVGTMPNARRHHTATLLFNGKVLVAGGNTSGANATGAAAIYEPSSGEWTATGAMTGPRYRHTATMLKDGRVLVVGGTTDGTNALASAELYDPAAGTWSAAASLTVPRHSHTATLLPSGQVLVVGGVNGGTVHSSAVLYTPATEGPGTWTSTGSLATARQNHTATLLSNGNVLVAGGSSGTALNSAEQYSSSGGTWSSAGTFSGQRRDHGAVLLPSGRVLVAGGVDQNGNVLRTTSVWNGGTSWTNSTNQTRMGVARHSFPAVLLPSGQVLVAGGYSNGTGTTGMTGVEIYTPNAGAGSWQAGLALTSARGGSTATILASGRVLIAGGSNGGTYYASSLVYDPTDVGSFVATGAMPAGREFHTATLLYDGRVLVAGGSSTGAPARSVTAIATATVYDPATGSWSTTTPSMAASRSLHTSTLLPSGRVLVAGGFSGGNPTNTAEIFDPEDDTWSPANPLAGARYWHTATLLPNGKVLVAGGTNVVNPSNPQFLPSALGTAELYDAATGTWSPTGSLPSGRTRWGHTATLLQDGRVLVVGGASDDSNASLRTADLYDPATGTWTATGNPVAARRFHSAILLPSGKVLLIGGIHNGAALNSTELYDPVSGTFTATAGTLAIARYRSQAVLLQSGLVLIAGGTSGTAVALDTAQLFDPASETWSNTSNDMNSVRHGMSFTLLQSGMALAAGGDVNQATNQTNPPTATCDIYDVGQGPLPAAVPTVASSGSNIPGANITVTGTGFTGISEASGGSTASSPSNYPLVELTAGGTNAVVYARVSSYTATSITATLPPSSQPGPYQLRALVNGVRSAGVGVTIYQPLFVTPDPATTTPGGSIAFGASGGFGAFTWSLDTNESGGTIDPSTGAYTAGPTGGVTDVVRVTDGLGNFLARDVTVAAGVSISSPTDTTTPLGTIAFSASGGNGVYTWSVSTNNSGGSITSDGVYTAGTLGGVTDVVRVQDSLGSFATRDVTVTAGVTIDPPTGTTTPLGTITFTASGGSGTGFTWSFATNGNASGGSITSEGVYTAGATGGVTDVVQVVDSLGNLATRDVTVTAGLTIDPATAAAPPRGSIAFIASGGSETGYTWSFAPGGNHSDGSITSGGAYTAGTAGGTSGVTDVVQVVDSLGNVATRDVTVGPGVTITPAALVSRIGAMHAFYASGGDESYTWSFVTNGSGGTISELSGSYQAGMLDGVDEIQAVDGLGNTATATVTVSSLFADFVFDVGSAGMGATVRATLTVSNDTAEAVTVTPPAIADLTLTALSPAPSIDPLPIVVEPGASARFTYPLLVTGLPGESYVAETVVHTSGGPTNLAITPAGTVAEVRVDWTPPGVRTTPRAGQPYVFRLEVTNDGASPVTDVLIVNPHPVEFAGLDADPLSCTSLDLPNVTTGADRLTFSGTLAPATSTTLCFLFADVAGAAETSYPFIVEVTRSGGTPPTLFFERSVRVDVAPPDVLFPTILSDSSGQTIVWTNPADSLHDGVVVFRTPAPVVPPLPVDYVDYRLSPIPEVLFAEADHSATETYADPVFDRVYNYRICNHDADFVYSGCSTGFWNGEGWLDSAIAPAGGWTQQLGGAVYNMPGIVPGVSASVVTNLPHAVSMGTARGDRLADPLPLAGLPARGTPAARMESGRTLLFAADAAGMVTAMDVTSGFEAWTAAYGSGPEPESFVAGVSGLLRRFSAPAFRAAYPGDVLFLGSTSGRLLALDAESGAPLWTLDVGSPIRAPTRYEASNNWLYVATEGGIVVYDLGTSNPSTPPSPVASWQNPGGSYRLACTSMGAASQACIDNAGVVRIVSKTSGVTEVSWETGLTNPQTIWYVHGASSGLVVSDATRVQRWRVSGTTSTLLGEWVPPGVTLSPVLVFVSEGTIYTGGSDATLHRLSLANAAHTGAVVVVPESASHCATPPCAVQLGPAAYDVVSNLFLFGSDDGRFWAVPMSAFPE